MSRTWFRMPESAARCCRRCRAGADDRSSRSSGRRSWCRTRLRRSQRWADRQPRHSGIRCGTVTPHPGRTGARWLLIAGTVAWFRAPLSGLRVIWAHSSSFRWVILMSTRCTRTSRHGICKEVACHPAAGPQVCSMPGYEPRLVAIVKRERAQGSSGLAGSQLDATVPVHAAPGGSCSWRRRVLQRNLSGLDGHARRRP